MPRAVIMDMEMMIPKAMALALCFCASVCDVHEQDRGLQSIDHRTASVESLKRPRSSYSCTATHL